MKSVPYRFMAIALVIGLASFYPLSSLAAEQVEPKQADGAGAEMQHLRTVLNRGLDILMGTNLVMLAEMKMSPGLDQEVLSRGQSMMQRGKKSIQEVLSGLQGRATSKEARGDAPAMGYVQALAAAMVEVTATLEKVKLENVSPDTIAMQYFNILISQALQMALEGSNQILMSQMGRAESVAKEPLERGRTMLSGARPLIIEVMGSRAMSEMHSRESGQMPAMGLTHKLAMDTLEVLDLLDDMPEGK
jgi:hypothetical protein